MIGSEVINDKPLLTRDARELPVDHGVEALPQCVADVRHRAREGDRVVQVCLAQRSWWSTLLSRDERASLGPAPADLAEAVVAWAPNWRVQQRDAVPATELRDLLGDERRA